MAQNELPTYERKESIQSGGAVPNYGDAKRNIASSTTLMSDIGARVAQSANQQMATQLGLEQGQNPHGTMFPPITEFDKHFVQSYNTQAQATLSIQAEKLISDSQIQMSKASRLTPALVEKTNAQVAAGLAQIANNAPMGVKQQLQANFASQMISNNQQYQTKIISQQREDQKNNLVAALDLNAKNASNLAMQGNLDAAAKLVEQSQNMARNGHQTNLITPQQAQVASDTVKQAFVNGKYVSEAKAALDQGKYPEWAAKFSNNPDKLPNDQWQAAVGAVSQQIGFVENLRKQDEALRTANMNLAMIKDPTGITGTMIQDFKDNVSPLTYANFQISYQNTLDKNLRDTNNVHAATANFSNNDTFRNFSDKALLGALDTQAKAKAEQEGVNMPEAEMQIAATAAGPIKGYLARLDTKAQSGNPQQLNEAITARDYIAASNHPQNVYGLKPESNAMMNNFLALKANHDEPTAAAMAREVVYNADTQQAKALDEQYSNYIKTRKKSETESMFALRMADIDKDAFVNVPELTQYVNNKFESYYRLNKGNNEMANLQLRQDINQTFDYDTTNGRKQFALFPIKKFYNLPENSNGFIHQDIKEQVEGQLKETKDLYDKGQFDYFWEVKPTVSSEELGHALDKVQQEWNPQPGQYKDSKELALAHANFERDKKIYRGRIEDFKQGAPPTAVRHWKDGHTEDFTLEVRASPNMSRNPNGEVNGFYDVRLQNKKGTQSFILANPNQSQIRYRPNRNRIIENYMKVYPMIESPYSSEQVVGSQLQMLGR